MMFALDMVQLDFVDSSSIQKGVFVDVYSAPLEVWAALFSTTWSWPIILEIRRVSHSIILSMTIKDSLQCTGVRASNSSILWKRCLIFVAVVNDGTAGWVYFPQKRLWSFSQWGAPCITSRRISPCWDSQPSASEMSRLIFSCDSLNRPK